jgi:hypothetical protein
MVPIGVAMRVKKPLYFLGVCEPETLIFPRFLAPLMAKGGPMTLPRQEKTAARGYGGAHQRLRKRWAPKVEAGYVACRRCGKLIAPEGSTCPRCGRTSCRWHLGHDDADRSLPAMPEHACCNQAWPWEHRRRREEARRQQGGSDAASEHSRDW